MLVLGLCVMMKILEYSSGHLLFLNNKNNDNNNDINDDRNDSTPSPPLLNNKERVKRTKRKRRKCTNRYYNGGSSALERGGCGIMSGAASLCEGVLKSRLEGAVPPDLNSNLHLAPVPLLHRPGSGLLEHKLPDSFISNTSSQDFDNSDYQWFLDYGYRETGNNVPGSGTVSLLAPSIRGAMGTSMSQPTSVFSSMSLSLGGPHDFSYDDLAKNLDANLAEIDMENFRTEDIHSILTLPTMCCGDMQTTNGHGEMIASVSGSLIAKIDAFEDTCTSSDSPHTSSTQDQSGSGTEMSICKSELLFSPVKECNPLPAANISVDSLDCELDGDLLLTCQANKDNYTIAFEGSVALCSEGDSDFHDNTTGESETGTSESNNCWSGRFNMEASTAFVRSDLVYTTWSKVSEMHRPESGNNNTRHLRHHLSGLQDTSAAKSQSLPNLHKRTCVPKPKHPSLMPHNRRMSQFSCSVESDQCVKLFDVQTSSSAHSNASDNGKQSFNLVKLFMKQKSISNDKMSIGGASYEGRQSNESSDWQSESDSCGAENNQHLATNNKLDNRQHGEFEDSLLHPNLLGPKLINETELASSELECSTRFYPVAEQNNTRNQDINNKQQQTQRNVDVINNVFTGPKPSNINNNNNNDTQRRCHGTQTKRINGSATRLTCSIDAVQPNQMRTTDIEMTSSPGPRRRSYQAPIATLKNVSTQIPVHVIDQGIQTSSFADVTVKSPFQLLDSPNKTSVVKTITPNIKPKPRSQSATTTPEDSSKPVYVYYPNYTLPDLTFLREKQDSFDANVFLLPQKYKLPSHPKRSLNRKLRPFSCNDVETLKKKGLSHIQDWDSLNVLLPQEMKKLLEETQENECHVTATATSSVSSTATQPSSGYRGSSTNISDSSSLHRTPYSPLYVYRYDSAGSESAVFRSTDKSAPPLPKRSISLSDDKVAPPRPPLPRGILRKDRKVERHSTGDIGILTQEVLLSKRLSLHDPTIIRSNKSNDIDEGVDIGMESSSSEHRFEARPPTPPIQQKKDILNNNTAQLWDEKEMLRLRSQVSHFLLKSQQQQQKEQQTQEQSLEHSGESAIKKSVSFAQKVSVLVKEPARPPTELLIPPPNSPNSQHHCGQRLYQCQVPQAGAGEAVADALSCSPLLEEILSVAPEGSTARTHAKSAASKPQRPVLVDLNQKRELVCAVRSAVEQVLAHYSQPQQAQGDAGAHHLALQALCPTLFALLGDGLRPHVDTVFGPVPNSTWRVVEASAQQGQVSKALNDLVMRLNGDDLLTEGLMKFNAFIFGLLNVHSLDAWLNYLRTRESVLQKHYDPSSFMFLANSATRNLFDQLVTIIEPLSLLPFKLDLLYERKVLEYSLQRLGQDNSAPISPTGLKEWTRKLVRSIQSSITQSYEEPTVISNSMRTALAEETEKFCPTTEIHNISPVVETYIKQRPRSCIDTQQNSFSLTDIASTMKKRWSGIQLGSKLFQAFDKLTTEETDEEYTDSLDKPRRKPRQNTTTGSPNNSTSDDNTEIPRDDSPPLSTETEDKTPTVTGEDKFRRLQMKWELLSKDGKPIPSAPKSRIPRLVSSPVRPTAPPIPQTLSVSKIPTTKKLTNTPQTTNKTRQLIKPRSLSRESTSQEETAKPARQLSLPPRRTTAMLQRPTPMRQMTRPANGVKSTKQPATGKPRQRTSLNTQCLVQTLCHRLPSDSGHLSFNEGEMLTVVLEVDSRWLLCCRGDQKGLVPKDDIIYLDN